MKSVVFQREDRRSSKNAFGERPRPYHYQREFSPRHRHLARYRQERNDQEGRPRFASKNDPGGSYHPSPLLYNKHEIEKDSYVEKYVNPNGRPRFSPEINSDGSYPPPWCYRCQEALYCQKCDSNPKGRSRISYEADTGKREFEMKDALQNIVKEIADLKSIVKEAMEDVSKQKKMKYNEEEKRLRMDKEVTDVPVECVIIEMNPRKTQKCNSDPVKNWGKEYLREAEEKRFRREELTKLKVEAKKNEDQANSLIGESRLEKDKEVKEGPLERILREMDSQKKHKYNAVSTKKRGKECLREVEEKRLRLEELSKLKVEAKNDEDKANIFAGEMRQEKDKEVKEGPLEPLSANKNWEKQYLKEAKALSAADALKASKFHLEEKEKATVVARRDANNHHADEYYIRLGKKTGEALVPKHRAAEVLKLKATPAMEMKGKEQHALRRVKTNRKLSDLFGGSDTENDDKRPMPMFIDNKVSDPSQAHSSAAIPLSPTSNSSDSCVISRMRSHNDTEDEEELLYSRRYTKTICRPPPRKLQDFP